MIMMSRIEMEMRIRQRELMREAMAEEQAESAKVGQVRVAGGQPVYSQFFRQRFGLFLKRLKTQPA